MTKILRILAVVCLLCAGPVAQGQEPLLHAAKTGVTAGMGLRINSQLSYLLEDVWAGVLLHIVPAVALRPSLFFYKMDEEDADQLIPASSTTTERGGLGVGLGAFYFRPTRKNFLLYAGPEAKLFFSSEMDFYDNGDKKSETYTRRLTVAALLGAQYMLGERFGFLADAGLGFLTSSEQNKQWNAAGTVTVDKEIQVTGFYIRPAYLGAVFYFN